MPTVNMVAIIAAGFMHYTVLLLVRRHSKDVCYLLLFIMISKCTRSSKFVCIYVRRMCSFFFLVRIKALSFTICDILDYMYMYKIGSSCINIYFS